MNKNQKKFQRRLIIKNIGLLIILLIPLYIWIFDKLFSNNLSIDENYNIISKIVINSTVIGFIGMVQFRCPECGGIISPRRFFVERCPYCDSELC